MEYFYLGFFAYLGYAVAAVAVPIGLLCGVFVFFFLTIYTIQFYAWLYGFVRGFIRSFLNVFKGPHDHSVN